jgi:hypothetical protein
METTTIRQVPATTGPSVVALLCSTWYQVWFFYHKVLQTLLHIVCCHIISEGIKFVRQQYNVQQATRKPVERWVHYTQRFIRKRTIWGEFCRAYILQKRGKNSSHLLHHNLGFVGVNILVNRLLVYCIRGLNLWLLVRCGVTLSWWVSHSLVVSMTLSLPWRQFVTSSLCSFNASISSDGYEQQSNYHERLAIHISVIATWRPVKRSNKRSEQGVTMWYWMAASD